MKFTKHDNLKAWLDLLPPKAIEIVGYVLRHGARKYAPGNWAYCQDHKKYIGAMLRHGFKHLSGESTDPESGLLHLAHAVCSGLFALELFSKIGESTSMERKQFSYIALIQRTSKHRGIVKKRFRSFEKAWDHLTKHALDPQVNIVRTVASHEKIGIKIYL